MLFLSKFRHLLLINRSQKVERRPAVLSLIQLSVSAQLHTDSHINGMALGADQRNLPVKHPHHFFFFCTLVSLMPQAVAPQSPNFPFTHMRNHIPSVRLTQTYRHTDTNTVTITLSLKRTDVCDKTHTHVPKIITYSHFDERSLPTQRLLFLWRPTCARTVSSQILLSEGWEGCDGKHLAWESTSPWGSRWSCGGLAWALVW